MKKTLIAVSVAASLFVGSAFAAATTPPDVLTKNTAQEVITILKSDKSLASNPRKLHALIEAKVLPHFDFQRMTQLAVGKYWAKATPKQRQELAEQFKILLVRTYSSSLAQFKNQSIEYKPFKMAPNDDDVTVRTQIAQPGGDAIPVDYHLEKTGNGWMVYDIIVDNVSLVTNYRGSFGAQIGQHGIDGLIKQLAAKNRSDAGGK